MDQENPESLPEAQKVHLQPYPRPSESESAFSKASPGAPSAHESVRSFSALERGILQIQIRQQPGARVPSQEIGMAGAFLKHSIHFIPLDP